MKITIIHGSPRKGNTEAATQVFKEEMLKQGDVKFVEFFMPKDLPEFCKGCMNCYLYGEDKCPHAQYTLPILKEMVDSDALIFTTPVFVMRETACIKNFLDHYGYLFIVHRARPEMFAKKAMIISSTVGAGTKDAIKSVGISLKYWGINKIHSYSFKTFGDNWEVMKKDKKITITRQIQKKARRFFRDVASGKRHSPYLLIRFMYQVSRFIIRKYYENESLDSRYWKQMGWYSGEKNPFRKS
ncbi:MAG TPA: flavodoxin family protein [Thermotogota bacterium]|nr:flavodoxin family protein [Thermotogota bacterium]HRW35714.1 flavodoxin family protein [Thermotogota bacterium]